MSLPVLPDALLADFLADDVRLGDLTTHLLGIGEQLALMTFAARVPLVLAGAEEAARMIAMTGAAVELHASSGTALSGGGPIPADNPRNSDGQVSPVLRVHLAHLSISTFRASHRPKLH